MPFVILLRCVCMCNAVYSSGMLLHGIAVYCSVILLHGNTIYCFILLLHGNATCCLDMLLCGYLHGNSYKHVHMHKHMLTCIQHTCMHSIACVRVCIQHACICTCMDAHWKTPCYSKDGMHGYIDANRFTHIHMHTWYTGGGDDVFQVLLAHSVRLGLGLYGCVCFICAISAFLLPIETKGRPMQVLRHSRIPYPPHIFWRAF